MKLCVKILPNILDDILDGKKRVEYRQIGKDDVIELSDGIRVVEFEIENMQMMEYYPTKRMLASEYPEIKWCDNKNFFQINLGKKLKEVPK